MLNKIVENIVNRTLLTEISCADAYQRFYQDIGDANYEFIISMTQNDKGILLPNTKWVLSCYRRNPQDTMDNIGELRNFRGTLDTFERLVSRGIITGKDADINRFKSLSDLRNFVYEYDEDEVWKRTPGEWSAAIKKAKNNIRLFYEDDKWLVVIPQTMDAACYWGQGTEWCTATRDEDENYFDRYNDDGPLFVLINKENGEKYQFHFDSEQFMDKYDKSIQSPVLKTIGASEGLINRFKRECEYYDYSFVYLVYEVVGEECHGLTPIRLDDNKYNLINDYNQIAFPEYTFVKPVLFRYDWAPVEIIDEENGDIHSDFMSYNGELRFKDTLNIIEMGTESYGLVYFRCDKGVNYFDTNSGEILSDEWFKDGTNFSYSYSRTYSTAIVKNNDDKKNILKAIHGELLSDKWYDDIKKIGSNSQVCFLIEATDENGKNIYNILTFEGKLILDKWYYSIVDAGVSVDQDLYFCRQNPIGEDAKISLVDISDGRIVEEDLDNCGLFGNHFGLGGIPTWLVNKNGKYNFLTLNYQYRLPEWADEINFVPVILPKNDKIAPEFMAIKYKDVKMPILKYGNEWYYPSCEKFPDEVKLIKYDKENNKQMESKHRKMKLTENDLRYIIYEAKKLLSEITIKNAYNNFYSGIDEETYYYIVSKIQPNEKNTLYKQTKWVLKLYLENPYEVFNSLELLVNENNNGYIQIFNRLCVLHLLNGNEREIFSYSSINDLANKVSRFNVNDLWGDNSERKKRLMRDEFKNAKYDVELLYEDDEWIVLIPQSYEASVYWGNGTKWCTAYKDQRTHYDEYAKEGSLYININKQTKEKYQFHFETQSFMDKNDENIVEGNILQYIGASEGMIEMYQKLLKSNEFLALTQPFEIIFENEYFYVQTQYREKYTEATYWESDNNFDIAPLKLVYKQNGRVLVINDGSACPGFSHFYQIDKKHFLIGIVTDEGSAFFHIVSLNDIMKGVIDDTVGEFYANDAYGELDDLAKDGSIQDMINRHPNLKEMIMKINNYLL